MSSREQQGSDTDKNFNLHPNPVTNQLTISSGESGEVRIIDMNGNVRIKGMVEPGQNLIDVSILLRAFTLQR